MVGILLGKTKKKKNTVKKAMPKTVQQTLPWLEAYENGVMQTEPSVFSMMMEFKDISFKTAPQEMQEFYYEAFMRFLNIIDSNEELTFTFVNMVEDRDSKLNKVAPLIRNDAYDDYRREEIALLQDKMASSRNSITTRKFITLRIEEDDVDKAMNRLIAACARIKNEFKRITKYPVEELNLSERLEILNYIMNGETKNFWFEHDEQGHTHVDFAKMAKQGLSTKDIISPSALRFNGTDFNIGERFGQAMYLDNLANWMNTNFISDIINSNFEGVLSIQIQSVPQDKGLKLIHNRSVAITAEVMEKQKKALESGYSPEFISADLKRAKEQVDELQTDMMNRDQRLFFMSMSLVHFAETREELNIQKKVIQKVADKYMCSMQPLVFQQERGFVSSLGLGINKLFNDRLLTTESLGVFIPFDEISQFDEGGFFYGVNAINKSLIVYNRIKPENMNYNGLILGSPGSGKSMSAKREMISAILNTNAFVFIIDPDGEYTPLANAFGGSVINLAPGNGVYLNPFDLDIDTSIDGEINPITTKTDFICGMMETMLGAGAELNPIQRSIMDRCVQKIYRPYFEHLNELPLDEHGKKVTIDRSHCPTMQNLYDTLFRQNQPEAQNLALVMETFTTGSFDTFAHRTNVDVDSSLIVYNIKNIGTNMRELALKVCMNDIWNKLMENRRKNRWTWFYVDEFHLLLNNNSTAEFMKSVYKRARKFQGVPTGITQNVEELLSSPAARAIINNSSFIKMLNQSAMDRAMLADLLKLSETDLEFITNVGAGEGLLYTGQQTIPFVDHYPKELCPMTYKIITTKATET